MNPPEEREMEKKSNEQLSEAQPLEEKATERLSQLQWPWAAAPPASARQSSAPTPASHEASDSHEVTQPCRPAATSSRSCSVGSRGFFGTPKGSLSHCMLLMFPPFQRRPEAEPQQLTPGFVQGEHVASCRLPEALQRSWADIPGQHGRSQSLQLPFKNGKILLSSQRPHTRQKHAREALETWLSTSHLSVISPMPPISRGWDCPKRRVLCDGWPQRGVQKLGSRRH